VHRAAKRLLRHAYESLRPCLPDASAAVPGTQYRKRPGSDNRGKRPVACPEGRRRSIVKGQGMMIQRCGNRAEPLASRFFVLLLLIVVRSPSSAFIFSSVSEATRPVDKRATRSIHVWLDWRRARDGLSYWIWRALPQVCPEHLPGPGYESVGMIFEPGKDVPVGTSKRRYQGVDRVFLNCAVCHTSTVRTDKSKAPIVVTGMPANNFDIMAFQKFFLRARRTRGSARNT
jgi:hypothetical protein